MAQHTKAFLRPDAKKLASTLKRELKQLGVTVPHQTMLEAISRSLGFRDDNSAAALMPSVIHSPRRRLVITVSGGLVDGVASDDPSSFANTDVAVVDLDCEDADEDRITNILTPDGDMDAVISFHDVQRLTADQCRSIFETPDSLQSQPEPGSREALAHALASELRQAGAAEDCLDELVHEACSAEGINRANETDDDYEQEEAISAAEAKAADINNQGFDAQVAAILAGWGPREGTRLIHDASGLGNQAKPVETCKFNVNVRAIVRAHEVADQPSGTAADAGAPWEVYDFSVVRAHNGIPEVEIRCDTLVTVAAPDEASAIEAAKAAAPPIRFQDLDIDEVTLWVDAGIDVEKAD